MPQGPNDPTTPPEDAHAGPADAAGERKRVISTTMHRLKATAIDGLLRQDGKHNDGGSLYLQVRNGRGHWVLERRDGASRRSIGLGSCPPVTLKAAREAAENIRKAAGPRKRPTRASIFMPTPIPATSPTQHASAPVRAVAKPGMFDTFAKVAEDFLEARKDQYSAERLTSFRSMLKLHMAPIKDRPIAQIESQEVADALRPIWNGSVDSTGRKLRPLVESIFTAAGNNPNPATLAALTDGLVHGLPKGTTEKAKSVASLPYAEVSKLIADLAAQPGDVARIIRFVILTGVRIKEALEAQWSEINLEAKTWTIPAARMKMDVEHVVPLSAEAIEILGKPGEGLIFRGERFGREIGQNVALRYLKTFNRVDAKGASVTLHGFRSSLATWAEERDPPFAPKVIHFNLAHYSNEDKITKAYRRQAEFVARLGLKQRPQFRPDRIELIRRQRLQRRDDLGGRHGDSDRIDANASS